MNFPITPCNIRRIVQESDCVVLESFYRKHEGVNLPTGYFEEFCENIRDPDILYVVAEHKGRIVGGGGLAESGTGDQADLLFGLVDPECCGRGFGTTILMSRLALISPKAEVCYVNIMATEWSAPFFRRLGFTWHDSDEDSSGNRFVHGYHQIWADDIRNLRFMLNRAGVTFEESLI